MTESKATPKTETPKAATAPGLPAGFKVAKKVTLPLSKWKNEEPKYLEITSDIFQGKEVTAKRGTDKVEEKPADLMNCIDVLTGEEVQVIVGFVLKSTLEEEYEDGSYVGKVFAITQHRDPGKKYNTYSITELQKA